jgi:hypothetical protein
MMKCYLWPQYKAVRSSPGRINWLLTEVVNQGILVAPVFEGEPKTPAKPKQWACRPAVKAVHSSGKQLAAAQ